MHELLAKSDRQLGMCLRMLYDEGIPGPLDVHSEINDKGKMEFHEDRTNGGEGILSMEFQDKRISQHRNVQE